MRTRTLVAIGVLVALLLAGFVSYYASSSPDGLNRVARDTGFAQTERPHQADGSPLAGYRTKGVANAHLSTGMAGVLGSLVVLGLAAGLTVLVRRRGPGEHATESGSTRTPVATGASRDRSEEA